jgi:hypothetical protein
MEGRQKENFEMLIDLLVSLWLRPPLFLKAYRV